VQKVVPVLHGLWTSHVVRAEHAQALSIGEQVLELGAATHDDAVLLQGNMEIGWSHFFLGHLQQARKHLERVLSLYDHERHSSHVFTYGDNPATSARSNLAQALWLLGDVDQSLRSSEENLTMLRTSVDHLHSVAFGLDLAAVVRQYRRGAAATRLLADEALALSEAHDLAFFAAMASILRGWVLVEDGSLDEGLKQMRRGLAAHVSTGAELAKPYWLCLIAEACGRTGAVRDGLELLDEAEATAEQSQERYWEAEIHRLRGDLLLILPESVLTGEVDSPEGCLLRALEVTRQQGARSLELRAAVSLARLWRTEGRDGEARELLARVYGSFSEGLDTRDLREAGAMLVELGADLAINKT
jgi:predicted ATPase